MIRAEKIIYKITQKDKECCLNFSEVKLVLLFVIYSCCLPISHHSPWISFLSQDSVSLFSKEYSFCYPFREWLCMKYPLTFCIGESSGFDSFYDILKTWVCIFLGDNMLRRKLQSSACSLVENMSFLPGCFYRIYYFLSWAIDFFSWSVGILLFFLFATQWVTLPTELTFCPVPQNVCPYLLVFCLFPSLSVLYFSNIHYNYVETFYYSFCATVSFLYFRLFIFLCGFMYNSSQPSYPL